MLGVAGKGLAEELQRFRKKPLDIVDVFIFSIVVMVL